MYRTANFSLGGPNIRSKSGAPGLAHEPPAHQGWRLVHYTWDGLAPSDGREESPHRIIAAALLEDKTGPAETGLRPD